MSWRKAFVLGIPASALALALMLWARSAYQIRTLPERVMEWTLQFVPLDLFERGLQTFGASAKEIALIGTDVGLALTLVTIAAMVLRTGPRAFPVVAAALWLFAMAVIMPLTGAGFFAAELPRDVILTNLSYLAIAVAYATTLALTDTLAIAPGVANARAPVASRRAFVGGVAGTAVTFALTYWVGRDAGASRSSLPLASVEPISTPPMLKNPTPLTDVASGNAAVTPTATLRPDQTPSPTPTPPPMADMPTATTVAQITIPPRPTPQQLVKRDKDGSLQASTRAVGQLADEFTPNDGFYITTKNAGGDPLVDPATWRLILDGEFVKPVQLDLPILYHLPSVEVVKTLECISNWVNRCEEVPFGCGLIGNARWKGVRLSDVFALAGGLKPGAVGILTTALDEFTSYIPREAALQSDTLLAYEMNGQVLPLEHGYPIRMIVPGRYGLKNPKWIASIRAVRAPVLDWYGRVGWNKDGLVQSMTRIDQPANGATLSAGPQTIAGIAYAGDRGVARVEFSVDGGQTWSPATFLENPPGRDVWVRWKGTFTMPTSGTLTLAARLVDGTGKPQKTTYTITQPDGGTGLFTATVKAG